MRKVPLIALLLYVCILLFGCDNKSEATISYTEENGLIWLPVTIEGQVYKFIFDTGSNYNTMNYRVVQKHGIQPTLKGLRNHYSHGGVFRDTVYYVRKRISMGGVKVDDMLFDLDHYNRSFGLEKMIGEDYHGIIGIDIIKTKNWLFDFKKKTVTISDKAIDESRTGDVPDLCFEVNPDSALTFADVLLNDSLRVDFLLDTGQFGSKLIEHEWGSCIFQLGIKMEDSLIQRLKLAIPIDGFIQLVSEMKMNGLSMDTLSVATAEKKMDIFYPGVPLKYPNAIGLPFLKSFDFMLYDKDRKQIRLYGYHAANQGEKDFLKARQRNLK